jgi:chemotaxis protein methyltransferase CheR
MTDQEYVLLKKKLLRLTGMDLEYYKPQQMGRRLDGFISSKADSVASYFKMIEGDEEAIEKLKKFLTINVSEFFRDAEHFNQLKSVILPELLKRSLNLRIWSAGCSYGAEAFTLAMILDQIAPGGRHRVLATDIDTEALSRARSGGPFKASELRNVDRRLLAKHFTKSDDDYLLSERLLRRVEFRRQDLFGVDFEREFDLILCRNVVIYFSDEAKTDLNTKFVRSLKDDGVMFIGATESMLDARDLGLTKITSAFYRKLPVTAPRTSADTSTSRISRG